MRPLLSSAQHQFKQRYPCPNQTKLYPHVVTWSCIQKSHIQKNFHLCSTAKRVILIAQENLSRHNKPTMITERLGMCMYIEICKVVIHLKPSRIASTMMQTSLMDIYLKMIFHPSNKYFWRYLRANNLYFEWWAWDSTHLFHYVLTS